MLGGIVADGLGAGGGRGRGGGCNRRSDLHGDGARDAHLEPALLDLDLAQAGLVQELGELADQLLLGAGVFALILGRHTSLSFFVRPLCRPSALSLSHAALMPASRPLPRALARSL